MRGRPHSAEPEPFLQHVLLCRALGNVLANPATVEAVRSMFIQAMCEAATSDLLCWSMEKGLDQGGRHKHAHASHVAAATTCMHEAEQALHLAGAAGDMEKLAWVAAEPAVKRLVDAYSGDDLCDDDLDTWDRMVSISA